MQRYAGLLAIVFISLSSLCFAGENDSTSRLFSFNLNHMNSKSGYGTGLSINVSIEKESRALEFGLIFQHETSEFSGGEFLYKHYLTPAFRQSGTGVEQISNVRLFLQYNFVFRNTQFHDNLAVWHRENSGGDEAAGRIATYEHYAGLGCQVRIIDNFSLNTSVGVGAYLGSINGKFSNEVHYAEGGRKNALGPVFRVGFGYTFKR